MKIVIYGLTDTRPVVYTLLKMLQPMGNIVLHTENPHYKRLIENNLEIGDLENIFLVVSQDTLEEILELLEMDMEGFDYVLYDSIIPEEFDVLIHVCGVNISDYESSEVEDFFSGEAEGFSAYKLNLGFGDKHVPYSLEMFTNIEKIEAFRSLMEVDRRLTKYLANIMQKHLNTPANTLGKVVSKKR